MDSLWSVVFCNSVRSLRMVCLSVVGRCLFSWVRAGGCLLDWKEFSSWKEFTGGVRCGREAEMSLYLGIRQCLAGPTFPSAVRGYMMIPWVVMEGK